MASIILSFSIKDTDKSGMATVNEVRSKPGTCFSYAVIQGLQLYLEQQKSKANGR